ncbi:MAG TPA: Holliday junction branch migration protein RuvA [Opitutaceae bacterium]|nr:Holliday junction branch migration protein RuvA [Opitutaceae bacterium]
MIASLRGTLLSTTPLYAVIEVAGVGYEVNVPVTTAERLPAAGQPAFVHTHVVYREDSQAIYGFATAAERDFFRLLIEKVSGVGPKVSLALMSHLSLPSLQGAIAASDADLLSKCPGIGRKTAERIILDLKDKLGVVSQIVPAGAALSGATVPVAASPLADAVAALVALGYKPADADKAVRKAQSALGGTATTEALIKKALS